MYQDQWMMDGVRQALMPGDQVVAKVFKVRQPGLYRWPVQLQLLEPVSMVAYTMEPEDYQAPISHAWTADQEWGMDDVLEATGRDYQPSQYLMPQNQMALANEMQRVSQQTVDAQEGNLRVGTAVGRALLHASS